MRKITLSLISAGILLSMLTIVAAPTIVLGDDNGNDNGNGGAPDKAPVVIIMGEEGVLDRITNWLFSALLVIAAIFIIIAGYLFVTAMGDPDKTKTARNFVMWALIGVLVAFCAKGLVLLVDTIVRGE